MRVKYRKSFLKDLAKIPSKYRTTVEKFVFEELCVVSNISEVHKLEKMKGIGAISKFGLGLIGLV